MPCGPSGPPTAQLKLRVTIYEGQSPCRVTQVKLLSSDRRPAGRFVREQIRVNFYMKMSTSGRIFSSFVVPDTGMGVTQKKERSKLRGINPAAIRETDMVRE